MLFLVLYLTGPRGLGVVPAGVIAGSNGVGALLGNFTGGRFGDRHGHRRVLLLTASVVGVLTALIPWQPVWLLAVTMPVTGYLGAVASLGQGALAALAVPAGSRRSSVAVSRAASNAGFVIGPPVGALLATRGYDTLFVLDGVLTLVLRHVTSRFLPDEAPVARAARRPGRALAGRPVRPLAPAAPAGRRARRPRLPPALLHPAAAPARPRPAARALHRSSSRSAQGSSSRWRSPWPSGCATDPPSPSSRPDMPSSQSDSSSSGSPGSASPSRRSWPWSS